MFVVTPLMQLVHHLAARADRALRHARRQVQNRAELKRMAELEDDRLRDLGITRAQVHRALRAHAPVDPMAVLREHRRWG